MTTRDEAKLQALWALEEWISKGGQEEAEAEFFETMKELEEKEPAISLELGMDIAVALSKEYPREAVALIEAVRDKAQELLDRHEYSLLSAEAGAG